MYLWYIPFFMASQIDYIVKTLQDQSLWASTTFDFEINVSKIIKQEPYKSYIEDVFEDLGGVSKDYPLTYSLPQLQCEDVFIVFNDVLAFNKYRNITFRSEFYDGLEKMPLQNYRRFCRTNEKQCLATGQRDWTNRKAEYYFGESQDVGDLSFKGSAQWKKRAFEHFLFDVLAKASNKKVIYLSIYDVIMINGQLTPLEKITLSQNEQATKYLWNYLSRLLGR